MRKLLTVSIAAYNVQSTLRRALDSFLDCCILPLVQVIIVDDGSRDDTPVIAQQYVQAHPETFTLVQKKNGGYGSTINTSIVLAQGVYFRVLDGDDWFDIQELKKLLSFLADAHEDIVLCSAYRKVYEGGREKTIRLSIEPARNLDFSTLDSVSVLEHHLTVFQTQCLLRQGWQPLLEHCFYTDEQYIFQGLTKAQTIAVVDCCPYCYRMGHAGQSVSVQGYAKHYQDGVRCNMVLQDMVRPYLRESCTPKAAFLVRFVSNSLQNLYGMFLCLPASRENKRKLLAYHRYMLAENSVLYAHAHAKKITLLRRSRFLLYRPMAWAWKCKVLRENHL